MGAEAKLNEARNRLTKVRRQHRSTLVKVEREVDSYNTRLKTASDDTKQKQKLLQAERSIRQTEDANLELDAALEGLVSTPDDDIEDHSASQKAFEEQSRLLADANEALEKAKNAAMSEKSCAKNEFNAVISRKERLTSRNTKLTEQYDRITQANAQCLNERERKAADSTAKDADQQRRENELLQQIQYVENEVRNAKMRLDVNHREIRLLEEEDARHMMLNNSGPLTPEGELPGTRPAPQHADRDLTPTDPRAESVISLPTLRMLTRFLPSSMRQLGERAAVAAGVRTVAVQQQGSLVARCAAHSEAVIVQDMSQALQLGDILFEGAWSMVLVESTEVRWVESPWLNSLLMG